MICTARRRGARSVMIMSDARVLYCDDEPDIREIIDFSLALDGGLTPRGCDSGHEALMIAAEWRPDLILLDVMMPGMDGLTTLARLHARCATACIPVVFMTARAQQVECRRF